MSQQGLDLRRSVQIVRRHKVLVGIVVALGLLIGGAYAKFNPPMLTSTTLIVLPQSATSTQQPTTSSGQSTVSPYTATQLVIADSNQVLAAALPNVKPTMSLEKLHSRVQVASVTSYIISVSAQGKSAADAEATANAVAASYIAYVNSPSSPIKHVSARILEPATSAIGTGPIKALVITGLIGALAGALIGIIMSLAVGRKDRRLRARDDIANSIGIPVFASTPVSHPSDAAGWTRLLDDYKPAAVHAWRLRAALQQLGLVGHALSRPLNNGDGGFSIAVLSLSSDPGALALGPQLAVFAASLGIPTMLVIGPQQEASAAATLSTAGAAPPSASSKRSDLLRVTVANNGDVDGQPGTALIIVVTVIDSRAPKIPDIMRTTATVIGVSAGAATAEQLARVAVVASADGREITGILVADPDPADRTTGRIPHLAPPTRRRLPSRLKGVVTEVRR
jgi:capsular polysaccharide biosynthesis protein